MGCDSYIPTSIGPLAVFSRVIGGGVGVAPRGLQ